MWSPSDTPPLWPIAGLSHGRTTLATGVPVAFDPPNRLPCAANDNGVLTVVGAIRHHVQAQAVSRMNRLVALLARTLVAWRDRQSLRDSLLAMDPHQLADIGLTRADIPAVIHGRFHRTDRIL